jgi:hypothetical protein
MYKHRVPHPSAFFAEGGEARTQKASIGIAPFKLAARSPLRLSRRMRFSWGWLTRSYTESPKAGWRECQDLQRPSGVAYPVSTEAWAN